MKQRIAYVYDEEGTDGSYPLVLRGALDNPEDHRREALACAMEDGLDNDVAGVHALKLAQERRPYPLGAVRLP